MGLVLSTLQLASRVLLAFLILIGLGMLSSYSFRTRRDSKLWRSPKA